MEQTNSAHPYYIIASIKPCNLPGFPFLVSGTDKDGEAFEFCLPMILNHPEDYDMSNAEVHPAVRNLLSSEPRDVRMFDADDFLPEYKRMM
jgi:hypothetical protein